MGSSETHVVDSHNQNHPEIPIVGSETQNVAHAIQTDTHVVDSENQHHAENPIAGNQTPPNVDQTVPTVVAQSDPIIDNGKKRISVELEDERANRLKVTLWDEHADRVYNMMTKNPDYPVVLIVQYVKCKKILLIFLNDVTIPDAEIRSASIQKISLLSSISGYTNFEEFVHDAEMLTLARIDDLEQASGVVVFAKISGLAKEYDWSYIGCSNCNSKVVEIESSAKENITGGIKGYPDILDEIVGKKCLFKLDVSDYNIRNNTSEISVARVTTDADVIRKYLDAVSDDQTIVSYTDDTDIGAPGDETGESPPPKKNAYAQCGEESVKSHPNKCVRKL
ncbi:OLC1v1031106C1 [Oldenlandia corymbosa var. corymbosa]|uniref:OLC1v1031106C1 n=1 Tax=Oldenlandia corymbosa var. corymbosa TaxID=529605 RepID=A0AAV1CHU0_OLDCO|nr:OLC1v1031106C1 [Oldenlandia corymbosa var. corymbosa]